MTLIEAKKFFELKLILKTTKSGFWLKSGVILLVTSGIGENAETIKDCGEVFFLSSQAVSIDKESFPTGIVRFHLLQRSLEIDLTVSYKS